MAIMIDPQRIDRVNPTPGAGASSYRGDAVAAAQYNSAQSFDQTGHLVSREAEKRLNELDDLRVIEASTELRNKENDLTYGQYGYATVKNGDVLKGQYLEGYKARYQNEVDNILNTLSPSQQQKFKAHALSASTQFQAGVVRHAMLESEKYAGVVFKADVDSRIGRASANYTNPLVIASEEQGLKAALTKRMNDLGINTSEPAVVDEFVKGTLGSMHLAVLDKALVDTNTEFAKQYFTDNKHNMNADQIAAFQQRFKPVNDYVTAKSIADDLIKREASGEPNLNVAQEISKRTSTAEQFKIADSLVAQYRQDTARAETEQMGAFLLDFHKAPTRQMMNTVAASPDFLKLAPKVQAQLFQHMETTVTSREHQALSDARAAETAVYTREAREYNRQVHEQNRLYNSPATIMKIQAIYNDPSFQNGTMKPEYIAGLAPEISPQGARNLLNSLSEVKSGVASNLKNFKINPDIVNAGRPPSAAKGENKDAYEGLIQVWTRDFITDNGRTPNTDEQLSIVRKAAETKWVDDTGVFGKALWTTETELYKLPPEQRDFIRGVERTARQKGMPVPPMNEINRMWENREQFKVKPAAPAAPAAPAPAQKSSGLDPATYGYATSVVMRKPDVETQKQIDKNAKLIEDGKNLNAQLKAKYDASAQTKSKESAPAKPIFEDKSGEAVLGTAPAARLESKDLAPVVKELTVEAPAKGTSQPKDAVRVNEGRLSYQYGVEEVKTLSNEAVNQKYNRAVSSLGISNSAIEQYLVENGKVSKGDKKKIQEEVKKYRRVFNDAYKVFRDEMVSRKLLRVHNLKEQKD